MKFRQIIVGLLTVFSILPCLGASSDYKVTNNGEIYGYDIIVKRPWVDVRAYGAKGDGVSDDTSAIQEAINATASLGLDLVLPNGTYLISSPLILSGSPSSGGSYYRPRFRSASGKAILKVASNITIMEINSQWIIQGIEFKGYEIAASTWGGKGILLHHSNYVKIIDCDFAELETGIDTGTELTDKSHWTVVDNCLFNANSTNGIKIRNSNNVFKINECTFSNGGLAGIGIWMGYVSGCKVSGGSIQSFPTAISIKGSQLPVIREVYFENNDNDIVIDKCDNTDPGGVASYDARNISIQDCTTRYKAVTSVFVYARNTIGLTIINNWAGNSGAGLIDANTTVKGIVSINNKNYESGTPIFKTSVPDGSIVQWADFHNSDFTPVNKFSNEIVWIDGATPSVAGGNLFQTSNSSPTTITNFLNGVNGQVIRLLIKDAFTTIGFTGTNLKGNAGMNWSPANGDWMECIFAGTNWYCSVHDCTP